MKDIIKKIRFYWNLYYTYLLVVMYEAIYNNNNNNNKHLQNYE